MKSILRYPISLVLLCLFTSLHGSHRKLPSAMQALTFVTNQGQIIDQDGNARPDVLAVGDIGGIQVYLRKTGLSYVFTHFPGPDADACSSDDDAQDFDWLNEPIDGHRLDLELVGTNSNPNIVYEFPSSHHTNYYLGHCPDGITNVPAYRQITYEDVYPNIDWVVYVQENSLKFDFVVHPGGNPADIEWRYVEANAVELEPEGTIRIETAMGDIREGALLAFQGNQSISAGYDVNMHRVQLNVGNYDTNQDLVIDPLVNVYSTYLGGSLDDYYGPGIASDPVGNIFMTGQTRSTNFPVTAGAFQVLNGGGAYDTYCFKFNNNGARLWATYYGGSGSEFCGYRRGIICDLAGNCWMSGITASANFPVTAGAHQTALAGAEDAYLVKWDNNGNRLYATYYGGTADEGDGAGTEVVVDAAGSAYLCTSTRSTNGIATGGAHQTTMNGSDDMFIAKFNSAGVRQWGTYYGGSGDERGFTPSMAVDLGGNVWMTSVTTSTNLTMTGGSHQAVHGGGSIDAFLTKFSTNGVLLYSTYYGGSGSEQLGSGVAVDGLNNVFLMGATTSLNNMVTAGAYQTALGGGYDNFLVKFTNAGVRQWGTYWGGSSSDETWGCVVTDPANNIWLGTSTFSANLPLLSPIMGDQGSSDFGFAEFTQTGTLVFATYWGGSGYQDMDDMVIDATGAFWAAGVTASGWPVTAGAFQSSFGGGGTFGDQALAKFNTGIILDRETALSVSAEREDAVSLAWTTNWTGEFEVQRSVDLDQGIFTTIGTVSGTAFDDTEPVYNANMFYRLRFTDQDAQVHYSNIVQTTLESQGSFSMYPNPAGEDGQVHLLYSAPKGAKAVRITVQNSIGQQVFAADAAPDAREFVLQTGDFARGVYIVSVATGSSTLTEKLVIR